MQTYYTSDWHLFHKNIIRYSNRPFSDVDEMNRAIITRTNERVKEGDRLFILGDLAFAGREKFEYLMNELVCQHIYLVPGNHDNQDALHLKRNQTQPFWAAEPSPFMEIKDNGRHVTLCHYAMVHWNKSHHGTYMLHGHSHGSLPGNSQRVDVGVDCWDFYPVTLDECIARMAKLPPYRTGDHHDKGRR